MIRFLAQRLGFGLLVLLALSTFVFFLFFVAPGDPARMIAGDKASEAQLQQIRVNLGVDQPMVEPRRAGRLDLRGEVEVRPRGKDQGRFRLTGLADCAQLDDTADRRAML